MPNERIKKYPLSVWGYFYKASFYEPEESLRIIQEYFDKMLTDFDSKKLDEKYIKRYSSLRAFPVIEKTCPYTGATEREWVKKLIAKMESEKSGIKKNILRSIFYPRVDYLWGEFSHLADKLLK